jgi:hypothetical protein
MVCHDPRPRKAAAKPSIVAAGSQNGMRAVTIQLWLYWW